jgi:von Willebrand factor type A domain
LIKGGVLFLAHCPEILTPQLSFILYSNAKCSRWDEISGIAKSIAYLSDASETPAEFRLLNLNKEKVVKVGQSNDEGKSLARAIALLSEAPRADTPICKAVNEVVVKMKAMEDNLRANDQYALVIILTDGESTDGDVIAALKQLEGLSVQIVIRVATDDNVVIEYWNKVNVAIDINVLVLDEFDCEASQIEEVNGWLTYGAALHRAREYGVVLPFMDNVDYCQLSQADIKSVVQML